jgi:phosphatidylglycerophosphate synthase
LREVDLSWVFVEQLRDWMFDVEYRRSLNQATRQVPLLHFLYLACVPLSKACVRLGLAPNTISHVSNALAALAVAALIWAENPWIFPSLWLAALLFDIADGIVARVTRAASASGSFYDHMSDQVKVIALFLSAGIHYGSDRVWMLAFVVCAGFLFMNLVNQVYALRSLKLTLGSHETAGGKEATTEAPPGGRRGTLREILHRRPKLRAFARGVYTSVFAMYGNSMLLVLPLGLGESWALGTLAVFGTVTLHALASLLIAVQRVNRQLSRHAIPWK